jgi:hypothetical protein
VREAAGRRLKADAVGMRRDRRAAADLMVMGVSLYGLVLSDTTVNASCDSCRNSHIELKKEDRMVESQVTDSQIS